MAIEEFEVKNLYAISGDRQSLYLFVSSFKSNKGWLFKNLITGKRVPVHDASRLTYFKETIIFLEDGGRLPLEDVLNNLEELDSVPATIEGMDEDDIADLMEDAAPYHDPEKFKPHHMNKILGWYQIISRAIDLMTEEE